MKILTDNDLKSGGSDKSKTLKKTFQGPCIDWKKACETEIDYVTQIQQKRQMKEYRMNPVEVIHGERQKLIRKTKQMVDINPKRLKYKQLNLPDDKQR